MATIQKFTPLFVQYLQIKEDYKDCILFYRLGDFYEMFFDDAKVVSKELNIALTGRDCGMSERAPMCGVPYHSSETYLQKLVEKGFKVAICEQITQPGDGLVKREVVRVLTKGTILEQNMLNNDKNNYLACIYTKNTKSGFGLAWIDLSTQEFFYSYFDTIEKLQNCIIKIAPSEIIANDFVANASLKWDIIKSGDCQKIQVFENCFFDKVVANDICVDTFDKKTVIDISSIEEQVISIGALLQYIKHTQKHSIKINSQIKKYDTNNFLEINKNAMRSLEIINNLRDGGTRGTLYSAINFCSTDMGKRRLRNIITLPLLDEKEIKLRQDVVEQFLNSANGHINLLKQLDEFKDIERLAIRLANFIIKPTELIAIKKSLTKIPTLKAILKLFKAEYLENLINKIKDFQTFVDIITRAINEDAPIVVKDGFVIATGYNKELDEYRDVKNNANQILAKLENREREETGIKKLKVAFNKISGFYIEIPLSQVASVPYRYIRKQTLANSERYITDELKEIEKKVLSAEENILVLEQKLYNEVLDSLQPFVSQILQAASSIAMIDVLSSFATVSTKYNYCRPVVSNKIGHIKIVDGRHPVAERITDDFVPNDTFLDKKENQIIIVTGPNMSGKSVLMKQVALITVLAECGCFVPARECEINIIDKIFTRVGAGDDMFSGRSTFMVEMSEVAQILNDTTNNSLILLDEIGRGTSTYDGLSIAWAIVEYLAKNTKAQVLFSTHYHELTEIEQNLSVVKNYKFTIKETENGIAFFRKLMKGSVDKSFGIEVAALSGLPNEVIKNAKDILKKLENADIVRNIDNVLSQNKQTKNTIDKKQNLDNDNVQIDLFSNNDYSDIIDILSKIDLDDTSPKKALEILTDILEKIK